MSLHSVANCIHADTGPAATKCVRGEIEGAKPPVILVKNRKMAKILRKNAARYFRVTTKSSRILSVGVICADNLQKLNGRLIPPAGFDMCTKHIFYNTKNVDDLSVYIGDYENFDILIEEIKKYTRM